MVKSWWRAFLVSGKKTCMPSDTDAAGNTQPVLTMVNQLAGVQGKIRSNLHPSVLRTTVNVCMQIIGQSGDIHLGSHPHPG